MLHDSLAPQRGGLLSAGREFSAAHAAASTWRIVVCSGNRVFRSAVCSLQPRVQWQCITAEDFQARLVSQPLRSMVLIVTEDWLHAGGQELLPSYREQLRPAQLQLVLFLEDSFDRLRLQALLALGGLVMCRLQLFDGQLLAQAINTALLNRPWVDPFFAEAGWSRGRGKAPRHGADLPRRERELLRHVGQGYNAQEISQRLGIRCDTVRRTLSRAYRRIGVRDRAQAVGWCLCHGLISRQELEQRYRPQVASDQTS